MRATLLYNPDAGGGEHDQNELVALLRRAGFAVSAFTTDEAQTKNIFERQSDLIVAAGGDGTVKKVATGLLDRRTPIAIIPLGTANNIARSLGISGNPESIVRKWRDGAVRRYDIGLASGPWDTASFIEAVGLGAFASTLKLEREHLGTRGERLRAGRKEFATALEQADVLETIVTIDGTLMLGDWLMIEVLNLSHSGPSLSLAPRADPGDGEFDVLCIGEERRQDMLNWLAAPDSTPPPIETIRATRVAFNWEPRHQLRIDDDLHEGPAKGRSHPVTISLQPVPLSFLLPASAQKPVEAVVAREPMIAK